MLSCYRILDLTTHSGSLCAKMLGDFGAKVVKIEDPTGDPGRGVGPFYEDVPHPEKSLRWLALNSNKRGITLDIRSADGQAIFRELVKRTDAVVESFRPGYMDELGLGYRDLSSINPMMVMTSITPFGQKGPYRDFKGPPIVVMALSGMLYTIGDPDRPPIAPSYDHAHLIGAANAAVGTLTALCHRSLIGRGQYVDSPTQLALAFFGCGEVQAAWELQGRMLKRAGRERVAINLKDGKVIYGDILWPCKDGDLAFTLGFGVWREKGNTAFVQWMKSEGYDVGSLEHWDFKTKDWSSVEEEEAREVLNIIGNFFLNHTKMEILEKALEIGLWMGLSLTVEDMVSFKHFKERDFFAEVAYPQLNASLTHPGPPVRFSDAACGIRCRAPFLGEHNNEIYVDELGFSEKHLSDLRERGVV